MNYGTASKNSVHKETSWNTSIGGYYKLNTNASFFSDGSDRAVGAVKRNFRGKVVDGRYCPLDHLLSNVVAEAMTLLKGFEYIEHLGCKNVVVESDSQELVNARNDMTKILGPYAALLANLAECFTKASNIENISFQQYPNEWDGDPPDFMLPFILHDVTLLPNK
jgi:ribonuclease HI